MPLGATQQVSFLEPLDRGESIAMRATSWLLGLFLIVLLALPRSVYACPS